MNEQTLENATNLMEIGFVRWQPPMSVFQLKLNESPSFARFSYHRQKTLLRKAKLVNRFYLPGRGSSHTDYCHRSDTNDHSYWLTMTELLLLVISASNATWLANNLNNCIFKNNNMILYFYLNIFLNSGLLILTVATFPHEYCTNLNQLELALCR